MVLQKTLKKKSFLSADLWVPLGHMSITMAAVDLIVVGMV